MVDAAEIEQLKVSLVAMRGQVQTSMVLADRTGNEQIGSFLQSVDEGLTQVMNLIIEDSGRRRRDY